MWQASGEGVRDMYKILFREPEGRKPLGRPGRRWKCNINIDLRELSLEAVSVGFM